MPTTNAPGPMPPRDAKDMSIEMAAPKIDGEMKYQIRWRRTRFFWYLIRVFC
jgi:hypothetical protein